jgi:hypothetical protein
MEGKREVVKNGRPSREDLDNAREGDDSKDSSKKEDTKFFAN